MPTLWELSRYTTWILLPAIKLLSCFLGSKLMNCIWNAFAIFLIAGKLKEEKTVSSDHSMIWISTIVREPPQVMSPCPPTIPSARTVNHSGSRPLLTRVGFQCLTARKKAKILVSEIKILIKSTYSKLKTKGISSISICADYIKLWVCLRKSVTKLSHWKRLKEKSLLVRLSDLERYKWFTKIVTENRKNNLKCFWR